MDKKEVNRVKKVVWRRFRNDEVVYVSCIPPKHANSVPVSKFIASGQIDIVTKPGKLHDLKPERGALILIGKHGSAFVDMRMNAQRYHLKTEHHDTNGICQVLEQALIPEYLVTDQAVRGHEVTESRSLSEPLPISQQPAEAKATASIETTEGVLEMANVMKPDQSTGQTIVATDAEEGGPLQEFAIKLLQHPAAGTTDGVGSRETNALIRSIDGLQQRPAELVRLGWLEPITREGKERIGGYNATDKLRTLAGTMVATDILDGPPAGANKYERAKWHIAQKPHLEAERAKLQERMAAIDASIERANRAQAWLDQADEF